MIQGITRRLKSRTFFTSLGFILAAEALVIVVAWLLLNFTLRQWILDKTTQVIQISQQAAGSNDWSQIDKITLGESYPPFDRYHQRIIELSQKYFHPKNGQVYLVVVQGGKEYDIGPNDDALSHDANANDAELNAYRLHESTHTTCPISDDAGTYFAAYTPILRKGKVIGLVAAENDSAPLSDLHEFAIRVFWSIVPAILAAVAISYIFAGIFVEPKEVPQLIADAKQSVQPSGVSVLWHLTDSEMNVFEALEDDPTNAQIALKLCKSQETVKTQMSSILKKSGLKRWQLVVAAQERRAQTVATSDQAPLPK